jgi:hypothetical protein
MNFINTSAAYPANALAKKSRRGLQMRYVALLILCLSLTACGTKPKDLKGPEPFPIVYPHMEPTPSQPNAQPATQSPPNTNPAAQPIVPN